MYIIELQSISACGASSLYFVFLNILFIYLSINLVQFQIYYFFFFYYCFQKFVAYLQKQKQKFSVSRSISIFLFFFCFIFMFAAYYSSKFLILKAFAARFGRKLYDGKISLTSVLTYKFQFRLKSW